MKKASILLVDDHPMVRVGIRNLLEVNGFKVVGEVDSGETVLQKIDTLKPDVILLDISLPRMSGLDVAKALQKKNSTVRVIVLTVHEDEMFLGRMIEFGVSGYLLKNAPGDEIIKAIRRVMSGEHYFSEGAIALVGKYADKKRQKAGNQEAMDLLTVREKQILQLIANGLSSNEIGKALFLSPRTVDTHRANIMHKLRIHNSTTLVRYAMDNGLVDGK